jgi:hypothetical protein
MRFFLAIVFMWSSLGLSSDDFIIDGLPMGKDVTLPYPANSIAKQIARFSLASNDTPQTIKLSNIHSGKDKPRSFKLRIFDSAMKPVEDLKLEPGRNYLYAFSKLDEITIVTEIPGEAYALKVESDKPLTILRK